MASVMSARPMSGRTMISSARSARSVGPLTFPSRPSSGHATRPTSGHASRPSSGHPSRPSSGNPSRPSSGRPYRPTSGHSARPSSGQSATTYQPSRPSSGSASRPGSGQSRPSSGRPITAHKRQLNINKTVKDLFKVSLAGLEHFEANRRDASRQLLRSALELLISVGDTAAIQAEMPAIICDECERTPSRLGRHYHAKWLCALADMERALARNKKELTAANDCARHAARLVEGLNCRLGLLQLSSIHHELGESHYHLSEHVEAFENFQKSLEIEENVNGSQSICVCVTLGLMAICSFQLRRFEDSKQYDRRALEILLALGDECGGPLENKDVARLLAERMDHLSIVTTTQYELDATTTSATPVLASPHRI
eukprot:Rmarinus@m.24071